eukprot:1492580-Lingulodinium_polyedra.AAC.1
MGETTVPVAGSLKMNATWHSRQPNAPAAQIAPQLGQPSTLPAQPSCTALIENSVTSSLDLSG